MRVFTPDEKKLLIRIDNGDGTGLYKLIEPWMDGAVIDFKKGTNNVFIVFDTEYLIEKGITLTKRLDEVQTILIQAVNLLKLFEDKGYLFSFQKTTEKAEPLEMLGEYNNNSLSPPQDFPDIRISELVVKYATQEIVKTPELSKFIADGFLAPEQVRADRQFGVTSQALRRTTGALIVSILALLSNIGFNAYNTWTKKDDTKKCTHIYIHHHCHYWHKK